jgi:hypothetical protein
MSLLVGCGEAVEDGAAVEKDAESPLYEQTAGGKDDSFRKPTELGAIELGQGAVASLTRQAGYLAWTFTLYGDATVSINTESPTNGPDEVDTVLYLYKQKSNGTWGSYIARNDDASRDTFWSALSRDLGEGTYRILVKGYSASDVGEFGLDTACEGAGCQPVINVGCAFGDTFRDARAAMAAGEPRRLTIADTLTALEQQQLIAAIRSSGRDEVMDVAAAFDALDAGELNIYTLTEQGGAGRVFHAFEYGLGDNSYGAIFAQGEVTLAARIGDGDIYDCAAQR